MNLYRDEPHFLKNKNNFNIFNDKDALIGASIPRLDNFQYNLPQFTAVFFNTQVVKKKLRNYIASKLQREKIIQNTQGSTLEPALNPFLNNESIDPE